MKIKTSILVILLLLVSGLSYAKDRQGIVTFKINLNAQKGSNNARLWLPYPLSGEHQRIENLTIKGTLIIHRYIVSKKVELSISLANGMVFLTVKHWR